ncbi:MAG: 4-phosphoerythronate dehydrogenase [Candidatus Lightella neohaematopini]|nr:4-phosphoerythronate dehydrogenase [Candidatus Lightella neohaematopini]
MKIVIDEEIPYGKLLFNLIGQVNLISSTKISSKILRNVDILIIRSVTQVNQKLLKNSKLKFIGSVTSGTDHINFSILKNMKIKLSVANGCNANAVAEYVFAAILYVAKINNFFLNDKVIGIIGVGNIGSCLYHKLNTYGVKTMLCDPFLEEKTNYNLVSLEKLITKSNIITLHTPLNKYGKYPTWHLINKDIIDIIPTNSIIINTARGSIIDNEFLLKAINNGKLIHIILDVWENEPNISIQLLDKVIIGTPHIAGYTLNSKIKGIIKVFSDCINFFNLNLDNSWYKLLPANVIKYNVNCTSLNDDILRLLINTLYNIKNDDIKLRNTVKNFGNFNLLRKNYKYRDEWSTINITSNNIAILKKLFNIGFTIK